METIDLEKSGNFEEAGDCPDCGGVVYENRISPESSQDVVSITRVCENHTYTGGDCQFIEEDSECPQCGGDLDGETRGADKFTGARSGKVTCTDCEFGFFWSE